MPQTTVFIACSLDGFIAGPNDELDWLPGPDKGLEDTFTPFFESVGALLMGRRTFDIVSRLGGDWPYGDVPVFVLTSRPLKTEIATVTAVQGPIREVIERARAAAEKKRVYLDGGELIRAALDAGLIDEIVLTVIPKILGRGRPLFAGASSRHTLHLESARPIGAGAVQLRYRVK